MGGVMKYGVHIPGKEEDERKRAILRALGDPKVPFAKIARDAGVTATTVRNAYLKSKSKPHDEQRMIELCIDFLKARDYVVVKSDRR